MDRENEQATDAPSDEDEDEATSQGSPLLDGFDGAVEPQRAEYRTIQIVSPFVERRRDDEDQP